MSDRTIDILVLDTNVVLDWLYFRDPRVAALGYAVASGGVRWLSSVAMRGELEAVLRRGLNVEGAAAAARVLEEFDRWAALAEPVTAQGPGRLRCTDTDDQMFIDLAFQVGATALLSRDKALLKLARRAAARSLDILTPERWKERRGSALPSSLPAR